MLNDLQYLYIYIITNLTSVIENTLYIAFTGKYSFNEISLYFVTCRFMVGYSISKTKFKNYFTTNIACG